MKLVQIAITLFLSAPVWAAAQERIDVRKELGRFFTLEPLQGRWVFKSVDERCEFMVDYWEDTGVVQITLQDDQQALGTSFRALTHREETLPLFNDKTYFSYYSDFSTSEEHMFVVEGVFEFLGEPADKSTRKILYLTRAMNILRQGEHRYVTYTASDRTGTDSKTCVF